MNNKRVLISLMFFALLLVVATSCSKKLNPLSSDAFTVNPSPLELVGTKIPVTVTGRIPANWFNKNAVVEVSTVLKYNGTETVGTTQIYQGENVAGNGIVISQKNGGNISLKSEFNYIPEMDKSELYLRFNASIKGKAIALPDVKVADGLSSAAALASVYTTTPALAPDKFQRIIEEAHDADIMFLIQQAQLRSSELNSTNLNAWKDLVSEANKNDRKNLNVEVLAYASPDGGLELNEKLAEQRERNTSAYLEKEFLKKDIDTEVNAKYTAQDWDGFQKLVAASSLQDKDLVLRVLSMYTDPVEREREIKNISVIYKDLAETILPKLRRSRLVANVEIIGKTDEELLKAVNSNNLNDLSLEELLYAANLASDSQKAQIYTLASTKFPNDYRAVNNLGSLSFKSGDLSKAKTYFEKAKQLNGQAAEANMNLGLIALADGDVSKAEQLLGNASSANTINEALGLLFMKKGDYAAAAAAYGEAKTNNAALAQLLSKNYNKSQQTLNALPSKDATSHYISALLAARTNNTSGVVSALKQATTLDSNFAKKALNDTDFSKFLNNSDIKNMLK